MSITLHDPLSLSASAGDVVFHKYGGKLKKERKLGEGAKDEPRLSSARMSSEDIFISSNSFKDKR